MMTTINGWTVKYDDSLKQYYYYNESQDEVSFDSPCEVRRQSSGSNPKQKLMSLLRRNSSGNTRCKTSRSNVLSRIGTAFQAKQDPSEPAFPMLTSSVSNSTAESAEPREDAHPFSPSETLGHLDDEYLINDMHHFRNFAGTSFKTPVAPNNSDAYSIDSLSSEEESIASFSEDNYAYVRNLGHKTSNDYSYNDYHYYYDEQPEVDDSISDRESERRELRMQIMRELDC